MDPFEVTEVAFYIVESAWTMPGHGSYSIEHLRHCQICQMFCPPRGKGSKTGTAIGLSEDSAKTLDAVLCGNCFGSLDNRYWNGILPLSGQPVRSPALVRLWKRHIKDFYKFREQLRRRYGYRSTTEGT